MAQKGVPHNLEETLGLAVRVIRDYHVPVVHIHDVSTGGLDYDLDFTGVPSDDVARVMQEKIDSDDKLKRILYSTTKNVQYVDNQNNDGKTEMHIYVSSIFVYDPSDLQEYKAGASATVVMRSKEPQRFEGKTFKEILKDKFGVNPNGEAPENKSDEVK